MENFAEKATDLEKYLYLFRCRMKNRTLFLQVVIDNITEMMPIVYTPTVGLACQRYAHIFPETKRFICVGK